MIDLVYFKDNILKPPYNTHYLLYKWLEELSKINNNLIYSLTKYDNIQKDKIYFHIIPHFSFKLDTFNYTQEQLNFLRNNKNIIVVYFYANEFYNIQSEDLNQIIEYCKKFNIEKNRFYYITGDLSNNNIENPVFKTVNYNILELYTKLRATTRYETNNPDKKEKHYICLNSRDKPERKYIIGQLGAMDLLKYGFVSFLFGSISGKSFNKNLYNTENFCKNKEDYINFWNKQNKPLKTDTTRDNDKDENFKVDMNLINNSYINIVNETRIIVDHKDFLFITEKTYKSILWMQPFLIIGNKGSLAYLRSKGYETFPELIDESYDDIENYVDRMNAVLYEIERICSLSIDELHEKYLKVIPKLKRNFNNLMNIRNHEKELIDIFSYIKEDYKNENK